MSEGARSSVRSTVRPGTSPAAAPGRIRAASLVVLVLLVVEYGIGMYVNLYVTVPKADQGGGLGSVISNGPATISIHAVLGLVLGLGALAVLVRSIIVRHWGLIALSVVGLLAMILASVMGTSFTSTGDASDSMGMSVMTGIALLCYAGILYLLRSRRTQ
jgi:hypothetical protein